jgi:LCP family protein required for cell wall assembly
MDAAFDPGVPSDREMFILAIGSDARPGQSVTRSLADSVHIIGVNPETGVASIVGIPRDSYVPIPGGGSDKINASLFRGGPELTVWTVERLTGIRIDAYALTAFEGFRRMVTEIGGLELRVPYPMSDAASGARFRAGPTRLDGPEALAFSRNRHDAPGGDFGRSLNQGAVLVAALRALQEDARRDPLTLYRWVAAGFQHLRTDLGLGEMFDLALAALSIDPSRVRNRVVSGGGGTVGGQSVVRLGAEAQRLFRDLARDGMLGGR